MLFNDHSRLTGQHAFLSASKYHWINYDLQKLHASFTAAQAARRGTQFHELAAQMIKMGVRCVDNAKTFNAYVNDALRYRMTPELTLFVSENCFGTADALSFKKNKLRIHDLKMGLTTTSFKQLLVYAAMFCLEYRFDPHEIEMELRIYQNDQVRIELADPDEVSRIIQTILEFDRFIQELKEGDA